MEIKFGLNEIEKIVREYLLPKLDGHTIFTFSGPLGAGKTTVIKELLRQSGVKEVVTSPTFSYVKHYVAEDGKRFNHFDLYRLDSEKVFMEMGFDEYLYDDESWTLIEWPEIINEVLQRSSMSRNVWTVVLGYLEGDLGRRSMQMTSLQ
jgi:tRNA threonylcarbamoyladenosine biosynthesis protein TsaE